MSPRLLHTQQQEAGSRALRLRACEAARIRRASIGKQQVHGREQKELFLFSSLVISFAGACAYSGMFCRSSGFRV